MLAAIEVHDPGLIGAFGGGMLSFLSPCVLPLVPGYLSLVSGISVAELQEGDPGNLRVLAQEEAIERALPFLGPHPATHRIGHPITASTRRSIP